MDKDKLLKIKKYLESINEINRIATPELVATWKEVYDIVYHELNGCEHGGDSKNGVCLECGAYV